MKVLVGLINGFGYEKLTDLSVSLLPSLKYEGLALLVIVFSSLGSLISRIFGIDTLAFGALLFVFLFELVSGLMRAVKTSETITSTKFSRFIFKVTNYLIVISVTYLMSCRFAENGEDLAASIFRYMHVFSTIQIVLENMVSISENMAVLNGRNKEHWVALLQKKVNRFLK